MEIKTFNQFDNLKSGTKVICEVPGHQGDTAVAVIGKRTLTDKWGTPYRVTLITVTGLAENNPRTIEQSRWAKEINKTFEPHYSVVKSVIQ